MAPLLTWAYTVPGGGVVEQVVLDEDGSVERLQAESRSSEAAEVGWWTGNAEPELTDAARALATERWPEVAPTARPSAAGSWVVAGANGQLRLDASSGGATGELLAAGMSCREAATTPAAGARIRGRIEDLGAAPSPIIEVEALGSEPVLLALETDPPVMAAWSDEEAEIHGFLGDEVELRPGLKLVGALMGFEAGTNGDVTLSGTLRRSDGIEADIRLTVGTTRTP